MVKTKRELRHLIFRPEKGVEIAKTRMNTDPNEEFKVKLASALSLPAFERILL